MHTGAFQIEARMREGAGGSGAGSLVLPTGERVVLGEQVISVGRMPESNIVLADPNVSRNARRDPPAGNRLRRRRPRLHQRHQGQREYVCTNKCSTTATSCRSATPACGSKPAESVGCHRARVGSPPMSEQVLNILKLCLLALVYLFLCGSCGRCGRRWRRRRPAEAGGRRGRRRAPASAPAAAPAPPRGRRSRGAATELVAVEPAASAGRRYPLGDEITVGRAAGCQVTVDDTYVSQLHARVFTRDGQLLVEDLGSTNGTYLNRAKVAGPMVMQKGDRLQVGNTVLEVR